MRFSAPSKLYIVAAALFLVVAVIGFSDGGLELKTVFGILLAIAMVRLALKARRRKSI